MPNSNLETESGAAQARALRADARDGGLVFEAYLPSDLADWVLDMVERKVFRNPSEAVFVILGEHKDLQPHTDLRNELLRRTLQAALDNTEEGFTSEEVRAKIAEITANRKPPAQWQNPSLIPDESEIDDPKLPPTPG